MPNAMDLLWGFLMILAVMFIVHHIAPFEDFVEGNPGAIGAGFTIG